MFFYKAFNLIINSQIPLIGYEKISKSELDKHNLDKVYIRKESITLNSSLHSELDTIDGIVKGILKCQISSGKFIDIEPHPEAEIGLIQVVVGGMLIAALLRQRGLLVLHGSCVANHNGIIAFVGDAGWGKSTLANFFSQNGYAFISDDLCVIDVYDYPPRVLPGPAITKLWPDSGEFFTSNYDMLPKVHENTIKRVHSFNKQENSKTKISSKLRKVYLLEGIRRKQNAVKLLSGQKTFLELTKHTRSNKWLSSQVFQKAHFGQCTTLLKQVPVSLLQRKHSLDSLHEIKEVIEQDLDNSLNLAE